MEELKEKFEKLQLKHELVVKQNLNLTNKLEVVEQKHIENVTKINKNQKIEIQLLNEKIEKLQLKNKIVVTENSNLTDKLKEIELKQIEQILE